MSVPVDSLTSLDAVVARWDGRAQTAEDVGVHLIQLVDKHHRPERCRSAVRTELRAVAREWNAGDREE
ncbi:hypothetical protein [Mycolicibacter algericus]|uniref:hypothetical protein n=1 Tax=Mycolicibacter algericus TaxID=1288388 RepID=UPI003C723069